MNHLNRYLIVLLGLFAGCIRHPTDSLQLSDSPKIAVFTFTQYGSFVSGGLDNYAMEQLCKELVAKKLDVIDPGRIRRIETKLQKAGQHYYRLTDLTETGKVLNAQLFVFGSLHSLTPIEKTLQQDELSIEVAIRVIKPVDGMILAYKTVRSHEHLVQNAICKAIHKLADDIHWRELSYTISGEKDES